MGLQFSQVHTGVKRAKAMSSRIYLGGQRHFRLQVPLTLNKEILKVGKGPENSKTTKLIFSWISRQFILKVSLLFTICRAQLWAPGRGREGETPKPKTLGFWVSSVGIGPSGHREFFCL